jgi:membrane dipeptidase
MSLITVIIFSIIVSLATSSPTKQRPKSEYYNNAIRILEKYPLIDGHNDMIHMIRKNFRNQIREYNLTDFKTYTLNGSNGITHTDIKRMREGRMGGQFWAIYANCSTQGRDAIRLHLEQLDSLKRVFKAYPNVFKFASTAQGKDVLVA